MCNERVCIERVRASGCFMRGYIERGCIERV